jgi:hypothetical protein
MRNWTAFACVALVVHAASFFIWMPVVTVGSAFVVVAAGIFAYGERSWMNALKEAGGRV